MRIVWSEQSARWFRSASEYTGYNEQMARLLLRHIPCRDTLCDIGCGVGLVDIALAPHIRDITCVDISSEAIARLEENKRRWGVENIRCRCADAGELTGTWDTVIALFFGGQDFMRSYFPLARERMILVTHGKEKGNMGPEEHKAAKSSSIRRTKTYLEELGVRFLLEERELEHGQPLGDMEEARAFVRSYSLPMPEERLEAYLEEKLEETGRQDYPLYLPNRKKFGIFVVERAENRALAERLQAERESRG